MPEGGREPELDERMVASAEREILEHVQHLHDEGIIDLDAPARAVVNALDRNFPTPSDEVIEARAAGARAGGYWLVGDQGWCNHLT